MILLQLFVQSCLDGGRGQNDKRLINSLEKVMVICSFLEFLVFEIRKDGVVEMVVELELE